MLTKKDKLINWLISLFAFSSLICAILLPAFDASGKLLRIGVFGDAGSYAASLQIFIVPLLLFLAFITYGSSAKAFFKSAVFLCGFYYTIKMVGFIQYVIMVYKNDADANNLPILLFYAVFSAFCLILALSMMISVFLSGKPLKVFSKIISVSAVLYAVMTVIVLAILILGKISGLVYKVEGQLQITEFMIIYEIFESVNMFFICLLSVRIGNKRKEVFETNVGKLF